MILNSNFSLKHSIWNELQDLYPVQNGPKPKIALFPRLIDLFILACAIGMKNETRVPNDVSEEVTGVNSKTYNDPANDDLKKMLDFLLKIMILTLNVPELEKYDRAEKEKLAFAADYNIDKFNAANILCEYANFGAIKISELITSQDTETISNILDYIDELKVETMVLPDIDDFDSI